MKNQGQSQVHDVDLQPGTNFGVRLDNSTRYYHHTSSGTTTDPLSTPARLRAGQRLGRHRQRAARDVPGQGPVESGGRVLVPLRGVLEKMGAYVSYDSARQEVHAVRNEQQIVLPIGRSTARVDDRPVPLDAPARILNGSTMVPLRFVAESLGARVNYEPSTSTVAIRTEFCG